MMPANLVAASALALWTVSADAASLSPVDAPSHVGKTATVCGVVASARYASNLRMQPTFLNLDEPYPNQIFTVVIFGDDRPKFGTPEKSLQGKRICVTGVIRLYREQPEIVLNDPSQLTK